MKLKIYYLIMLLLPLLVLEGLFRLLPVSYPPHILAVNGQSPIARYQENFDYRWSRDWDFSIVTSKRTNNLGFVNDADYARRTTEPLMAIIGDSFVEAQQVANAESLSGILADQPETGGRVYSLGMSGAALAQYLAFADYARREFAPDSMVFAIVANDFDESLLKYKSEPRFHYFVKQGETYKLTRIDYEIGTMKKLLRKSAFARYLMLNLRIQQLRFPPSGSGDGAPPQFVGNVPRQVSDERLADSIRAVDEFLRQLPARSGLAVDRILFVMDGMRPNLYSPAGLDNAKQSFHDRMRSYFKRAAGKLGYELRDMQPVFIERNRRDGSVFEFQRDAHWNQLGHKLVAEEIRRSGMYAAIFGNGCNDTTKQGCDGN